MYRINQDVFFVFTHDGELAIWDYRNHRQFILTNEYFQKIFECAKNGISNL